MNILLIDNALPSSVFSGKTVRLKNIYGALAKEHSIIYLRTAQAGEKAESEELELWARDTFQLCLRLSPLPSATFSSKLKTALQLKPWYDVRSRFPDKFREIEKELRQLVQSRNIDLVITLDLEVAYLGEMLAGIPWIQDLGDSIALQLWRREKFTSGFKQWAALKWRSLREARYESQMIQKSHAVLFVADDDAAVYEGRRVEVVRNGVDLEYFNPDRIVPLMSSQPYLLFTGHMSFQPNQDAAIWFASEIFPLVRRKYPDLKFVIAGADPSKEILALSKPGVIEVTGRVADMRPYLAGAKAFVCPMRMGSGIKNKVLEALAMKVPVISTRLGIKGIQGITPEMAAIADTPSEFASAVEVLYSAPEKIAARREKGRRFVESSYSWKLSIDRYREIFQQIARRKAKVDL